MATLDDLAPGIKARLQFLQGAGQPLAAAADAQILLEDAHDVATQIQKSAAQYGMIWLIGEPFFENATAAALTTDRLQLQVKTAVAIREDPTTWRKNDRPHAAQVAQLIAQGLHGWQISGFNYLKAVRADFVADPKVKLYEIPLETTLVAAVFA